MIQEHWLILYDIRNAKRLAKVEKCVSSYAWRIQKSVFESNAPKNIIDELKKRLHWIINKDEDFILIFNVCERDWQKQEKYGVKQIQNVQDDKFTIL